ncbi:MAG: bacteriohemerythrin [Kiritimatiellota bacterium]|nr:bacteriohemerythrin [Kiritimatiellota bacterium]
MASSSLDPKYSVHVPEFDGQHQKLLGMIEQARRCAQTGASPDVMARLFEKLLAYTRFHFNSEEQVMRRYNFDGYAAHQREHQALISEASNYHRRFIAGKTMIPVEIMRYLNDWLLHHIETVDRQYDMLFHKKGVTQS